MLPCPTILYRTITTWRKFQDGRPTSAAFLLRPANLEEDRPAEEGISVDFGVEVPDGCGRDLTGKKAIISLHCGTVRDLGLSVEADTEDHAEIRGMPNPDDDVQGAENFAAKLVAISRTAWTKPTGTGETGG